ncbi:hypothetical protein [Muribaculum sp.]|uniref:hypothetical protein n=1 Tax=Muribaculum sp. TaxID=1918611 RepID=UPI0023C2CC78|nr:hypothetical protein [Muribaculum sp.]MDE5706108.1 hypothetical protein [Muribaculum sp.]
MEDRKLTEQECLEVITSMIARTKQRYIGDGNVLLMWGYLTVGVTALIWILLTTTHNPAWNWLWFIIWIVGGVATPLMAKRQLYKNGVKNYSDTLTSRIWSIVGFSAIASTFICLGFLLIKGIDTWSMMLAFALIIVPFAEIVQGIIVKEKSLMAGGSIGLVFGIFTVCCIAGHIELHSSWFMPLFMLSFIAMMIVPGHILNHKASQEK